MNNLQGVLETICDIYHINYTIFDADDVDRKPIVYGNHPILDPHSSFIKRLLDVCQEERRTHVMIDITKIVAGCIYMKEQNQLLLIGLAYIGGKSMDAIIKGLMKCKLSRLEMEQALQNISLLSVYSLSEIRLMLQFLHQYVNGKDVPLDIDHLVIYKENKIIKTDILDELPIKIGSINSDIVFLFAYSQIRKHQIALSAEQWCFHNPLLDRPDFDISNSRQ